MATIQALRMIRALVRLRLDAGPRGRQPSHPHEAGPRTRHGPRKEGRHAERRDRAVHPAAGRDRRGRVLRRVLTPEELTADMCGWASGSEQAGRAPDRLEIPSRDAASSDRGDVILGRDDDSVRAAYGVDAVQALHLAENAISVRVGQAHARSSAERDPRTGAGPRCSPTRLIAASYARHRSRFSGSPRIVVQYSSRTSSSISIGSRSP
jgi:hypothetical protein